MRDMQRTMERLTDVLESLTTTLHHMQQERSSRVPRPSGRTPQPRSMEPDAILAQIHRWQQEGMSLRAIAAKLNAEGVPTRSGQGKWYESNLSRLLKRASPR
jgi:hypothetical protein